VVTVVAGGFRVPLLAVLLWEPSRQARTDPTLAAMPYYGYDYGPYAYGYGGGPYYYEYGGGPYYAAPRYYRPYRHWSEY
jgi:hypothetical protein